MATREEIKKTLKVSGTNITSHQDRVDAALLSIMEKQDAGSGAVKTTAKK